MPIRTGPLLTLANRLFLAAPPSLSTLKITIFPSEEQLIFMNIVKDLLPERAKEIFALTTPTDQISEFATRFADRYFPLHPFLKDGKIEGYEDVMRGIPIMVHGVGWEEYEQIPESDYPGHLLMTYVVKSGYDEGDARVTLATACQKWIPEDKLRQLSIDGLPTEEIHRIFGRTKYKGLAAWADILNANTGNYFLDTCDEEYNNSSEPDWTRENVEELTKLWQQSEAKYAVVNALSSLIDKDPVKHFQNIVDLVNSKKEAKLEK